MKLKISGMLILLTSVLIITGFYGCTATAKKSAKEAPRMLLDELKALMEDTSVVIIDVWASKDWDGSLVKIRDNLPVRNFL